MGRERTTNGDPREGVVRRDVEDAPVSELLRELGNGTRELVRKEVQLARAELTETVTDAKRASLWMGIAAVPGLMALVILPIAAMWALAEFLPTWVAGLVVGGALLVITAIAALVGRAYAKRVHPKPEQTVESLKEDRRWLRQRLT